MKKLLLGVGLSVNLLALAMDGGGSDGRPWCWESDDPHASPAVFYADNDGSIYSSVPLPATQTPAGVAVAAADSLADNQRVEDRNDDGEGLTDAELAMSAQAQVHRRFQAMQALMAQAAQGPIQDGYARFLGENFDRLVDAGDDQIIDELWPDAQRELSRIAEEVVNTVDLRVLEQMNGDISDEQWARMQPSIPQRTRVLKLCMQQQLTGEIGKAGFRMQCILLKKTWAAHQAKQQAGAGGAAGI